LEQVYQERRNVALADPVADTLNDLALTHGAAWIDIAKVVGVSVPALRKWRVGAARPRHEHRERLAAFVACLEALRVSGVAEPAGRFQVRLLDNYSVTLTDVFAPERVPGIVGCVTGSLSPADLLDYSAPDWRTRYKAQTRLLVGDDGELAMDYIGGSSDRD
jgi:hypothetical protein